MVVEFQKLHSNYLQSKGFGLESEGRINKLHPSEKSKTVSADINYMCAVSNKNKNKTILTNTSDGLLSFKGKLPHLSADDIESAYNVAKRIVDPKNASAATDSAVNALKARAAKCRKEHPFLAAILDNKVFQKAMTVMNQNQLLADAGIALLYTCCLRPLSIAALPTKDNNEKEKNKYQIGHSISTGIIGFATAFVLQTPIKHAIDKVTTAVTSKNAQKYISKEAEALFRKENIEKIRMVMERSHQPITLPLKALLTIFLVPKILKLFGLTKKPKQKVEDTQNQIQNQNQNINAYDAFKYYETFKSKNSSFQNFSGGLSHENK